LSSHATIFLVTRAEVPHHRHRSMGTPSSFGAALTMAREAARMSKTDIALALSTLPNTVYRWETTKARPSMEVRIKLLRVLSDAPRDKLQQLADEAEVSLASIGLGAPPPPAANPAVPPPAPAPPPIPAGAQAIVDDAVREAAEELDLAPKALRPVLSRMLDRLARAGVPVDAAARMVLGVPKKGAGT
jgi:transcriptional regulator with XRE-family HTH domain